MTPPDGYPSRPRRRSLAGCSPALDTSGRFTGQVHSVGDRVPCQEPTGLRCLPAPAIGLYRPRGTAGSHLAPRGSPCEPEARRQLTRQFQLASGKKSAKESLVSEDRYCAHGLRHVSRCWEDVPFRADRGRPNVTTCRALIATHGHTTAEAGPRIDLPLPALQAIPACEQRLRLRRDSALYLFTLLEAGIVREGASSQ